MKKEEEQAHAEIMYLFRYFYKDAWAPENIFNGKSRVWVQVFNNLINLGFIERKKKYPGYKYRWTKPWPMHY